jgi:Na+-driven multidrug efflux pump
LIGQSLGENEPQYAKRVGWRSARLALGTAIVLGIIVAVARYPLARLFTADEAVVAALGPFMLALAIAQPFLQLHFTLGGAHRGAGDTWTPLVAATVGNWVFRVPLALIFAIVLQAPVVWVWYTLIIDHVARAIWLTISFRRGRWVHHLKNP